MEGVHCNNKCAFECYLRFNGTLASTLTLNRIISIDLTYAILTEYIFVIAVNTFTVEILSCDIQHKTVK